jgi:hypothetical protein
MSRQSRRVKPSLHISGRWQSRLHYGDIAGTGYSSVKKIVSRYSDTIFRGIRRKSQTSSKTSIKPETNEWNFIDINIEGTPEAELKTAESELAHTTAERRKPRTGDVYEGGKSRSELLISRCTFQKTRHRVYDS